MVIWLKINLSSDYYLGQPNQSDNLSVAISIFFDSKKVKRMQMLNRFKRG